MFLITGCQRSGTTLLGIALDAHRDIDIIEEDNGAFQERAGETLLLKFQHCLDYAQSRPQHIGFKAPRDSHRLLDLTAQQPDLKILWLMRPAVQVVASMMSLEINALSWAAGWAPREIRKYLAQFEDRALAKDFTRAEALADDRQRAVAMAALCWRAKLAQRHYYTRHLGHDILNVDYENLVRAPEPTLKNIAQYLGVAWDENMCRHEDILSAETRPGASSTARPIDKNSLAKWQNILSPTDLDITAAYSAMDGSIENA